MKQKHLLINYFISNHVGAILEILGDHPPKGGKGVPESIRIVVKRLPRFTHGVWEIWGRRGEGRRRRRRRDEEEGQRGGTKKREKRGG